uniref:Uncharacterized protein n=1 Tax=Arundo donax TaxID=35708 RepID=A0A0A8YQX4_ARUDO
MRPAARTFTVKEPANVKILVFFQGTSANRGKWPSVVYGASHMIMIRSKKNYYRITSN